MEALCQLPQDGTHPFNFGSKIMYGSDWYMPIATGVVRGFTVSATVGSN